jgi:CheY-like chemotaxis protein
MDTPKKILIVDDDSFLLDMYALKFTQAGYTVDTALGPKICLEKLRAGLTPDIMLMDIVMPEMDGFEMLEVINTEGLISHTIKIVLSNRGQSADVARGQALGVSGYIVKANTTPTEVIGRVAEIITAKKS